MFVYPSLYEGFGFPVAQAMASSVPVITSNVSSLPEVVGAGGILIEPKSVSQLAAAIRRYSPMNLIEKPSQAGPARKRKGFIGIAAPTNPLHF